MPRSTAAAAGSVIAEGTSLKAINTICGKIRKAYGEADALVHEGLIMAIAHADEYRNVTPVAQVIDAMPLTSRRALAINWVHMATNIRLRKDGKTGLMRANWLTADTQSVKDGNDFLYVDRQIVVRKDTAGSPLGIVVNPLTISETDEVIKERGGDYSLDVIKTFPTWHSDASTGTRRSNEPGVFTIADADDRVTSMVSFLRRKADNDPRISDEDKRTLKAYARELEEVHNKYKPDENAKRGEDLRKQELISMVETRSSPAVIPPVEAPSDGVETGRTGTNG